MSGASFFSNATTTAETSPLSLHDALPIYDIERGKSAAQLAQHRRQEIDACSRPGAEPQDRKSTRLNSSHRCISYAVFCLKKKTQTRKPSPSTIRRHRAITCSGPTRERTHN